MSTSRAGVLWARLDDAERRPECSDPKATWHRYGIRVIYRAAPDARPRAAVQTTGVTGSRPAKWAARLARTRSAMARRVSTVAPRLLRCGRDRLGGGFPNAGYEPHPSCGDCPLTGAGQKKRPKYPEKSLPDNNS